LARTVKRLASIQDLENTPVGSLPNHAERRYNKGMNSSSSTPRRVAVVGGGIAGLAAAHRLIELDSGRELTLFEAGPRLGGVISTVHEEGFQVEQSADNFITTVPWGVDLCKRLGLGDQLLGTNPAYRRTFIVRRGRLHRLPDGFLMMAPTRLWPLALTPLLSPLGKLRAALEYFIPPRGDDADESMAQFVRRRLGREAFDRLVEPLVSAVYAADLEKLSVLATLSRFREMERDFGSLIRAMRHSMRSRPGSAHESGARYSMFVTLRGGLTSLVEAIASRLPPGTVQLNTAVTRIERSETGWRLGTKRSDDSRTTSDDFHSSLIPHPSSFDAIILATPSPVAAKLLQPLDVSLAADLASIEHSGVAVVSLGYDSDQIGHPLDGMGAVVPAVEQSPILAVSFSSQKYPHRAPAGKTLLRVFAGGARRPELAAMSDAELKPLLLDELSRLLQVRGQPSYCGIARWPGTMPQYHVGHKDLIARIESRVALLPNLALAGNAYHGVGIPDCIHGGELAAERVLG
jgi:protoporphyrinogen/coproporphyrinogen III oxidase